MTVTTDPRTEFRELAAELEAGRGHEAPDWIRKLRRKRMEAFEAAGLPTLRHEDWRFTNLARIAEGGFSLPAARPSRPPQTTVDALGIPGLAGPRLVFLDGRFVAELSSATELPEGVVCGSLAAAARSHRELVEPHLDRLASARDEAFSHLNGGLFEDGLFLHVADGVTLDEAVHVVVAASPGARAALHPRSLVVVGKGAQADIVEDHVSLDAGGAMVNAVTEIVVGDGGTVRHHVLQRQNDASSCVTTVLSEQGRDSRVESHSALVGGALHRNNAFPVLRGEGGWCLLNGCYVPRGTQHHDTFMVVRHSAPHCDSRQFYRGILDERSKAVFSGRIVVDQGAQKTDAKQTNRNLLLSDDAQVDTKPQLEIYADDVKCTHGATVGQLDPEEIFYLRSRGIPEETARGLLTFAFVNEVVERMPLEPVRALLRRILETRLPGVRPSGNGS